MSAVDGITSVLKRSFCASLDVTPVPVGFAISTGFSMPDGDLLSFYMVTDENGLFTLEDDGTTLPNAIAAGLDLKSPNRESLLRGILADEGIHYGNDLTIRSDAVKEALVGETALRFISALIRTRDLSLMSRENVAASFSDDVRREIIKRLPDNLIISEDTNGADPGTADITLRNAVTGLKAARIYAAAGDLRLMDALVDYQSHGLGDAPVIAIVDRRKSRVSEKRFNNATNLGLQMAIVDGDTTDWVPRVLQLALQATYTENQPLH